MSGGARWARTASILVALLIPFTGAAGLEGHAAAQAGPWAMVKVAHSGSVLGISGLSSTDVWAVGYFYDQPQGRYRPLTQHWDGTRFRYISAPTATRGYNAFNAVVEVSPTNVWAVGYHTPVYYTWEESPLIEHFDGSKWRIVSSPYRNLGTLTGIAAISPDDIWAVGYRSINPYGTLIEHWDGRTWSLVDDDHSTDNSQFYGVVAAGPDDVWAGGSTQVGSEIIPFAEHWNGSGWTGSVAQQEGEYGAFNAVTLDSGGDLWGAGWKSPGLGYYQMSQRYDGSAWTTADLPDVGEPNHNLYGAASAGSDVWTVGYAIGVPRPLIEHWNGTAWSVEANPGRPGGVLYSISRIGSQVWAGGDGMVMRRDT